MSVTIFAVDHCVWSAPCEQTWRKNGKKQATGIRLVSWVSSICKALLPSFLQWMIPGADTLVKGLRMVRLLKLSHYSSASRILFPRFMRRGELWSSTIFIRNCPFSCRHFVYCWTTFNLRCFHLSLKQCGGDHYIDHCWLRRRFTRHSFGKFIGALTAVMGFVR